MSLSTSSHRPVYNEEDIPHTVDDPRPSIRFSSYALHGVRHDVRNLTTLRQHDLLIDRGRKRRFGRPNVQPVRTAGVQ
jgi:hypothetical protein